MTKETITTILAIWGAMLSSIAIGWNLYRDISQRGRLRVNCYLGKIVDEARGLDPKNYIVWNITNVGKEPSILTTIGGAFQDSHFLIKTRNQLPLTLKPGEYILEYSDGIEIFEKDLKYLWAIDSIGKYYKAPRKQMKILFKDYPKQKMES